MLKSEKALIDFYRDKISKEASTLNDLPSLSDCKENMTKGRITKNHSERSEFISALVAVAFAGFCFALTPVFPYRHFDESMKIFSEVKIEKQHVIAYAQAVSLSFCSR